MLKIISRLKKNLINKKYLKVKKIKKYSKMNLRS